MSGRRSGSERRRALACALACAWASVLAPPAARGDARVFDVPTDGPLPDGARSFVAESDGAAVASAPGGALVGRTEGRAAFALGAARPGRGCRVLWVQIGPNAWVCGARGALSSDAPVVPAAGPARSDAPDAGGLPWSYAFTARDGARAYRSLAAALARSDAPGAFEAWESNWGMAVAASLGAGDARVVRTRDGWFVRRAELYRAAPTDFAGGAFGDLVGDAPGVPFGWVALGDTRVYPAPSEDAPGELLPRLSRVRVYALREASRGRAFARIGPGRWVRADHVRWIAPEPPPAEVNTAAGERWIDVDVTSQTLIAYRGAEPVYATLVATGGERYPTERGVFRIWGRYLAHTMDNTESAHLPNHFRLGDVPYVQFFDHDRGLHGVYWHDRFGVARSHGCVNLAPRDAAWLFAFTAHPLPAGWVARAMPPGGGTVVRVRGRYRGTP